AQSHGRAATRYRRSADRGRRRARAWGAELTMTIEAELSHPMEKRSHRKRASKPQRRCTALVLYGDELRDAVQQFPKARRVYVWLDLDEPISNAEQRARNFSAE